MVVNMAQNSEYYEEAQNQFQEQQRPMVAPYINEYNTGHSDLVKLALHSGDIMDDLKMNLLALEWDSENEKWVQRNELKPLISMIGAQKIITEVSSIVNRNT